MEQNDDIIQQLQNIPDIPASHSLIPTVLARLGLENEGVSPHTSTEALLLLLRHDLWQVRLSAVRKLRLLAEPEADELLRAALEDENEFVRMMATQALESRGSNRSISQSKTEQLKTFSSSVDQKSEVANGVSATTKASPVTIFYSYSVEDKALSKQLETHLSSLKQQGMIVEWHNRQIEAGTNWAPEIDKRLSGAQIILLFISPDFLASDYYSSLEMQQAMVRHKQGKAHIIPIIVRPCEWQKAPFAHLQALPRDGKPIAVWENQDAAWLTITQDIRQVVAQFSSPTQPLSHGMRNEISYIVSKLWIWLLAIRHILSWNHAQEAFSRLMILVKQFVKPVSSRLTSRCASRGLMNQSRHSFQMILLQLALLLIVVCDVGEALDLFNFIPASLISQVMLPLVVLTLSGVHSTQHELAKMREDARETGRYDNIEQLNHVYIHVDKTLIKVLGDEFFTSMLAPFQMVLEERVVHFSDTSQFHRFFQASLKTFPSETFLSSVTLKTMHLWTDASMSKVITQFIKGGGRVRQVLFVTDDENLTSNAVEDFRLRQKLTGINIFVVSLSTASAANHLSLLENESLIVGSEANIGWEIVVDHKGNIGSTTIIANALTVEKYRRVLKHI